MDDAGAVQRRRRPRQFYRDVTSFLQSERRAARQPGRQELALIKRHHRVEAALPPRRLLDDVAEPGAVDARAHPRLAAERLAERALVDHPWVWEFQRHLAALDLV